MGEQLELVVRPGHGGKRAGAGRKKAANGKRNTPHRQRPTLSCHTPVHLTLRAEPGLPSFRLPTMAEAIGKTIRALKSFRDDFRVVEFSIQSNHLHLLVEADDERSLASGVMSLKTRITRRVNRHVLHRPRGKVWSDRYHRTDLTSGKQVRRALVYVLQNAHHHGVGLAPGQRDPLSSARWSDRYINSRELPADTSPCWPSRTFVLNVLWERSYPGPLSPTEVPREDRARGSV